MTQNTTDAQASAQVTQDEVLVTIMRTLTSMNDRFESRMGALEASIAGVEARSQEASLPEFIEKALEAREETADAEEITPTQALSLNGKRTLYMGEQAYGETRKDFSRSGLEIPKGSMVTMYLDADEKEKFRVWVDAKYRTIPQGFATNGKNVRKLGSISKRIRKTVTPTRAENKAHAQAILDSLSISNSHVYEAGTQVKQHENSRTGNPVYVAHDGKNSTIVSASVVKNGKLTEEVARSSTHLPRKVRRHIDRHNKGAAGNGVKGGCTCKPNWLCPAAQALGPTPIKSDKPKIDYVGAHFPHEIDNFSETLVSRLDALAWGIDD